MLAIEAIKEYADRAKFNRECWRVRNSIPREDEFTDE